MPESSAASWLLEGIHHSKTNYCSAAALCYLNTHTLLDPDALELVLNDFAFLFSLTDFVVSLVSLCCPLQLVCFLSCSAGMPDMVASQDKSTTSLAAGQFAHCQAYAQVYDYGYFS